MKIRLVLLSFLIALTSYSQDEEEITVIKELYAGWNLIGFYGDIPMAVDSALSQIWEKVEVVKNLEGYYLVGQEPFLNSLDTMKQGEGYLVKVSNNCQLQWSVLRYNYPPIEPYALLPINGADNVDTSFYLRWRSIDHERETLTYTVFFDGNNPPETEIQNELVIDSLLIENLDHDFTYYWQIIVQDEYGHEVESEIFSFITNVGNECSLVDVDGNTYPCVQIGEQVWMAQDLKVTHYPDGTEVSYSIIDTTGTGYLDYSEEYFGLIYSWSNATRGMNSEGDSINIQGICPDGWHIPNETEWDELFTYTYNNAFTDHYARELMCEWGWQTLANSGMGEIVQEYQNQTGFSSLPSYIGSNGGNAVMYWSSTLCSDTDRCFDSTDNEAVSFMMDAYFGDAFSDQIPIYDYEYYVRCIKD